MRAEFSGAIALFCIAAIIAAAYFVIRGIIRYMRQREADRQEMIALMRKQNRRS